jgi:hypothetical protein
MVSRAGFLAFLRNAGFTVVVLPDASTDIDAALAIAQEIVYEGINDISTLMFDLATYNLGTSTLIEIASDQPNSTYFADLRTKFKMDVFSPGIVASTGDEGTNVSFATPDWAKGLQIADLQYLKNAWGMKYLSIAQKMGTLWGVS